MSTDEIPPYIEETFGILTDDDIYLDCVLVKPAELTDEDLKVLRVWVPKFPLTKASLITCARQEVSSYGPDGKIAHLVFDLRGTGDSEGAPGDKNFQMDLRGIRAWADERFGQINFGFLGTPDGNGSVAVAPIRPGVTLEYYRYGPKPARDNARPLIYMSTYGNFDRVDDALCLALSQNGYDVYGFDPLRYLLMSSARGRLTASEVFQDANTFARLLNGNPLIVGQPISAGLALLWMAGVDQMAGVIAIGRAQAAFQSGHIFKNYNPHAFFLGRFVANITPRPVVLVINEGHPLGGTADELGAILETCREPRRLERTREINPPFLMNLLNWLQKGGKS
jgi:hypothetical protein